MSKVKYDNAGIYRHDIGVSLYADALKMRPNSSNILEIGPGRGDVARDVFSAAIRNRLNMIFVEPDANSAAMIGEQFPMSRIIARTLESAISANEIPHGLDLIVANFSLHWVEGISRISKDLYDSLTPAGVLAIANTDPTRSFWAEIDSAVKSRFPGNSLFNIEQSHSLSANDWEAMMLLVGFQLRSRIDYHGTAAVFASPEVGFADFKRMAGSKYLKLANGATKEQVESYVKQLLEKHTNLNGQLEVKASGFRLILQKAGATK